MTLAEALKAITFTTDSIKRPYVGRAIKFDKYGRLVYKDSNTLIAPFKVQEIVADDWEVLNQRYTFMDAMEFVKEGKKVRRNCWGENTYVVKEGVSNVTLVTATKSEIPYDILLYEVFATDWEILD